MPIPRGTDPQTAGHRLAAINPLWPQAPHVLRNTEPHYPALLRECPDAPATLFCVGADAALHRPAVAVVGTRQPSADGMRAAHQLGYDLAAAGITVVSGLARGIDTAAHSGALEAGGQTVAVMATGLDRIYPAANQSLARRIAEQGVVITEFAPGCEPHRWHFPRRNRTLSGLALATVVVEAGRPSGSLLTAAAATEQGRDVFAYPWSVYHRGGAGCRWLLGDGAQLACDAADVVRGIANGLEGLIDLQWHARDALKLMAQVEKGPSSLSSGDQRLLTLLGDGELEVGRLSALSGKAPEVLLRELARLELAGWVETTLFGYRRVSPNI